MAPEDAEQKYADIILKFQKKIAEDCWIRAAGDVKARTARFFLGF